MKFSALILFLLLFAIPAFSCVDFNGEYEATIMGYQETMIFKQNACKTASVNFEDWDYIFDGKQRALKNNHKILVLGSLSIDDKKVEYKYHYISKEVDANFWVEGFYTYKGDKDTVYQVDRIIMDGDIIDQLSFVWKRKR